MKVMNTIQTDVIIVLSILLLVAIAIIVADRIKCKYYSSKGKMVVLRVNNPDVRNRLNSEGLSLCQCAYYNTHKYLYTIEGDHICGFTEECTHLIEDAIKNHQEVIDCDIDVSKFVNEVKKLQQEYETKEKE
jgi:hypothetical protein|nr:MAG TPA: hypothetical protein [Caudoviricetes sp.]